jgi:hypothetical protein
MRKFIYYVLFLTLCILPTLKCESTFKDGYDALNEKTEVVRTLAGGDGGITFSNALVGIAYYNSTLYTCATDSFIIKRIDCTSGAVTDFFDYSSYSTFPIFSCHIFNGSLYIGDSKYIAKLDISTKICSHFCGSSSGSVGSYTNGNFDDAQLNAVQGITSSNDELFISDMHYTLRKLNSNTVTTIAGIAPGENSTIMGYIDAIGTASKFYNIKNIVYDSGYIYICDEENHAIRRLNTTTQQVETIAGSPPSNGAAPGFVDGYGVSARFNKPYGIAKLGNNLYVTDGNNYAIRKINLSNHMVTTIAGNGSSGYKDGIGSQSKFSLLTSIVTDGKALYICDRGNRAIRKIDFVPKGQIN